MGKIRVKTFDESTDSEEKAKKLDAKRQAKKEAKQARPQTHERSDAGQAEKKAEVTEGVSVMPETATPEEKKSKKKEKFAATKVKKTSPRHKENISKVKKDTALKIDAALTQLRAFKKAKFDETVELHINVKETGISGAVTLPHGTGKVRRIKIADDALIEEITKGKIEFDVLVAEPAMMPKLAKVARILGPKGLMPNPKNGTISPDPKKAAEKLAGGQVNFKTEAKTPIIHMSIGKLSFTDDQLKENIKSVMNAIAASKVNNATLKSSMSPGIRLEIS